jgi:hypothetical protein
MPCRTVYASASRWGCGLQPFGLCANLRFCDEGTDSQAVAPNSVSARVNQLRNIDLGRSRWCRNMPTNRSVPLDYGARPSHPQTFPQGRGVSGLSFPGLYRSLTGHRSFGRPRYSPGSLLPSIRFAKRVELCKNARLNLPIGPLRCLAMMISARPLRSGSSCL